MRVLPIPQDFDNNKNFWAKLEHWSRQLINRGFDDVWVLSGPAWMPESYMNAKNVPASRDLIKYETIGKQRVAIPSHLYKVVVAKLPMDQKQVTDPNNIFPDFVVAAFLVPNKPIPKNADIRQYEVPLAFLEQVTGIHMFPRLNRSKLGSLCMIKMVNSNESVCFIKQKE